MPKDEFEPDDPMELVGVAFPTGDVDEMAECLVEEFVKMGMGDEELLQLFRSPFYGGTHAIYKKRGEEYVRALITRVREQWGPSRWR